MDVFKADYYLRQAIGAMVGPDMHEVTPEQVGILKLLKLAVETEKFMRALEAEGRDKYTIGEYHDKVYSPIMKL